MRVLQVRKTVFLFYIIDIEHRELLVCRGLARGYEDVEGVRFKSVGGPKPLRGDQPPPPRNFTAGYRVVVSIKFIK
jgi:hypothetical protein